MRNLIYLLTRCLHPLVIRFALVAQLVQVISLSPQGCLGRKTTYSQALRVVAGNTVRGGYGLLGPLRLDSPSIQGPSWGYLKSQFSRDLVIFLAINAHKMAPKTSQGLQKRAWNAPTKGLLWVARRVGRVDLLGNAGFCNRRTCFGEIILFLGGVGVVPSGFDNCQNCFGEIVFFGRGGGGSFAL